MTEPLRQVPCAQGGRTKTYRPRDYAGGPVREWIEVTMEQWDRCSEHRREILMLPGRGMVFVAEVQK